MFKLSGEAQAAAIKYAAIAIGVILVYQFTKGKVGAAIDGAINAVNPFVKDGFIGKLPVNPKVDSVVILSKAEFLRESMRKAGKNIDDYYEWFDDGFHGSVKGVIPPGTMKISYLGKTYFYAPRKSFLSYFGL